MVVELRVYPSFKIVCVITLKISKGIVVLIATLDFHLEKCLLKII